jgi:7-carboxy-7-deazaguanine synthase
MVTDIEKLKACARAGQGAKISLKFVVMDDADYTYAKNISAMFPEFPVYLQPCNHTPPDGDGKGQTDMEGIHARMISIVNRVVSDRWYSACVLPQLHVILWGNKRGV